MKTWRPLKGPPREEKCYSRVKIYCLKQSKANDHQKVTVQKLELGKGERHKTYRHGLVKWKVVNLKLPKR